MALWGISANVDEAKPKWLTEEQKKNVYATDRGWVQLNGKGLEEVIVAIGGLAGGTSATAYLGAATISNVEFSAASSYSEASGGTVSVVVTFNERVDITGTPQVTVSSTGATSTFTLDYASHTRNRVTFTATGGNGTLPVAEDDVLSIGANAVSLNGGTVFDYGTSLASVLTHDASTSTLTVAA